MNARLSLLLLSLAAVWCTAQAHMGLEPPLAEAGSRTIVTLRVGHDCGDETVGTTNFTVVLPPHLPSVSVEQKAGWRVMIHKVVTRQETTPEDSETEVLSEYVSAVTFLGFLPDGFYELFNLRIKMPETPNATLWFKGYQDCHNQGESLRWESIPSAEDPHPRYPARNVTLVERLGACGCAGR